MMEQSDIHFSCTQCGQCCAMPPHMNLYDMISLSDEFIFQTYHSVVLSSAKKPLDKQVTDFLQIIGHTIVLPEFDCSLFYYIDFLPITYPSVKSCPKLENNLCSIYGKRPSSCKLAPLNISYDDSQQWRPVEFFQSNTLNNNWKCDFSEKSPIILKNNEIYDLNLNSLYFQSVNNIRNFTNKYIEYLSLSKHKDSHFKLLFKSYTNKENIITDVVSPLKVALHYNLISYEQVITFVNNQIFLLTKELDQSIFLKLKDNLKTSRLYKQQLFMYKKALSLKLFTDI